MYLGNYTEDYADLNFKFTTRDASGAPTTLSGTPAVSVYKSNDTTQSTAGVTLTADFDSVTGLNNVKVDLSADAFYAVGEDYAIVITAGTVDSNSVVGEVVATFSIENRFDEADMVAIGGDAQSATDLKDFADSGYDPATNKVEGVKLADTLTTYTSNTPQSGDAFARLGAPAGASVSADIADLPTVSEFEARTLVAASYFDPAADTVANVTTVGTCTTNTDMRGTDNAALAATLGTPTDFGSGTSTIAANLQDIADNGTAAYDRSTDSLQAIRDRGDSAWTTATGFSTHSAADVATALGDGSAFTEAGGTGDHLTAINLPNQTMDITGNITGNLSGSVGSVTGAVGSVTGAVGSVTGNVGGNVVGSVASVTGNVGGNVTGSVGSVATGGITAASIATDAIDADAIAADAVTEIQSGLSTYDGSDTSGTTTLLSRLTATRAGYLDNLSAGAVATASKLLKYFQLLFRSDAAIATDNATELTAINADEGSGAGDYSNQSEAVESLRDRGDSAWITATGFSTLDAAGVRTAVGLSAANLDTQLTKADLTAALTEAYRSTGATGSAAQLLYEIIAHLGESSISGTTKTIKQLDGSTTAKTYTLDDATNPTSITETT